MSFIVGLDLGQSQDYTAITVVERVLPPPPAGWRPTHAVYDPEQLCYVEAQTVDTRQPEYHVRHLERPALGTPYPQIVTRVRALLGTPPLTLHTPLVLDRTGVGAPVADLFATGGLSPWNVTITGGDTTSHEGHHYRVPKREIVSVLVTLFQTGRLKIAAGLPEAGALTSELANFKVKVNIATGNESYEAWRERDHDDIVLALGLAVWYAERGPRPAGLPAVGGRRPDYTQGMDPAIRGLLGDPRFRRGGY